jgi:hypothetical protein
MLRRFVGLALVAGITALIATPAMAQLQFGGTDTGGTGGTDGTGGATTTGGGTGGTTGGQSDFGAQGQLIEQGAGSGQIEGNERFYRPPTMQRDRTTFVGADSSDARNIMSPSSPTTVGGTATGSGTSGRTGTQAGGLSLGTTGRNAGGLTSLGGLNTGFGGLNTGLGGLNTGLGGFGAGLGGAGGFSQLGAQAGGLTGATGQTQQRVRAQMSIGFRPRPVATPQLSNQLASRLGRAPQFQIHGPLQVELVGRTVVLRGTVDSAHARDLAERMAMLEPGVSTVQNELSVAAAPAAGGAGAEE